jgi:uroporphyrin-3 C-methyltransferase
MANNSEPDIPATTEEQEAVVDVVEQDTVEPAKKSKPGKGTVFIAILSLLLANGALAASAYIWLTMKNDQQQVSSRIDALDGTLQSTRSEISDIDGATQQLHTDIKRIDDDSRGLRAAIDRTNAQLGTQPKQWSIEEVHQLLVLATDQLSLANNVPGALTALRIADQRIVDSGEPMLQPVREQLAIDIASLAQVEQLDLAGISHKLKALENSIDKLPFSTQSQMKPAANGQSPEATGTTDQTVWQQLGKDLSGLVRIRRLDQPAVPLLPAEQQYFVRENIKARLNTARIALLRGEQQVYLESLQQAQSWVNKYFDPDSQSAQWLNSEILALTKINTEPELPDITRSLASLENVISETARP